MKLYCIVNLDESQVLGITEDKKDAEAYKKEKNFPHPIIKIKEDDVINDLMMQFEELYIEHDAVLDLVLTRVELKLVYDILEEEKYRLLTTSSDLQHYISNYSLSKKEKSVLKEARSIVKSCVKKRSLKKVIDLHYFIELMKRSKSMANTLKARANDLQDKIYIFINKD